MAYFRLLNEKSVERACLALFSDLAENGLMGELPALAASYAKNPVNVVLDGFNLIGGNPKVKPYTWFLPKPRVNTQEMLRIYESVASQPLSELDSVGNLASHIYPRNSDERRLFTRMSAPDMWLSPALLLAAAAQYLGPDLETFSANSVSMRIGNGLIQVGPDGCWSNLRKQTIPAACPDLNPQSPVTWFPETRTDNPVIGALLELCDESDVRYAVTVLALALKEEIINKSLLNKIAKLEHPAMRKAHSKPRNVEDAARALAACEEILNHGVYDIIPELFDVAVPELMSFRRLQSIVGAPSQVRDGRVIREETLNNWRIKFQAEFEDLLNAKT